MASQYGPRFVSPICNQNFLPNSFNMNPNIDGPPRPQFQRPPDPSNGSFQAPERFVHGFQSRPHFSNFPGACGFLNRLPPPPQSSTVHPPPLSATNPFPVSSNSASFPCPSNSSNPPFPSQPPVSPHAPFTPRHPVLPSHRPPPLSQPPFISQNPFSPPQRPPQHTQYPNLSQHNQHLNSSHPPLHNQQPNMSHSVQINQHSNMSHPLQHNRQSNMSYPSHNEQQNISHLPQHNEYRNMAHPPQHNQQPSISYPNFDQHPNMSHHSQNNQILNMSHLEYNQRSNMPKFPEYNQHSKMSNPPQHNQHPSMIYPPRQNQSPNVSHSSDQHQGFRVNSPSPVPGPGFDISFQRSYEPWNKRRRFSGLRTPFSNRSPNVHQFKDTSRQVSKKRQKSGEFRKLKEDSTEKPFSCDTCDRAFVTKDELSGHISQHITCDYENCTFEAHPKIVLLHKKMQHETGYAERIGKLQDDAEVKKWREERRKRFPTAENIRKRKAEQAEREARGEVIETKEFGKFKRRCEENGNLANGHQSRTGGHQVRRKRFRKNYREKYSGFQWQKINSESDSDSDSHISLNMFSGLSCLANSAGEIGHSDETVETNILSQNSPQNNPNIKSIVNSAEEISQPNETIETNFLQQNLPKIIPNINENHLNVSHSENNLICQKIKSPVNSNSEKSSGKTRSFDESVLEVSVGDLEISQKEIIEIEDSDDEGPEVIAITKHQEEICVKEKVEETRHAINIVPNVSKNLDDAGKEQEKMSDVNAVLKVSKKNHDDANEKKETVAPNDEPKASEVNDKDSNKGYQSKRHWTRKEKDFSAEQNAANNIRKSSLLEKLLADDIRHERNVILQCIRHIVNNNFFGLAVKKS